MTLSKLGPGARLHRFVGKRPEAAPRPVDLRDDTVVGGGGVVTPRGDSVVAGDGYLWLVCGGSILPLGTEVDLMAAEKAFAVGDLGLFKEKSGGTVPVQRVKVGDVPDFVVKTRNEFFVRSGRRPAPSLPPPKHPLTDVPDAGSLDGGGEIQLDEPVLVAARSSISLH